jgi:hypothetical protein
MLLVWFLKILNKLEPELTKYLDFDLGIKKVGLMTFEVLLKISKNRLKDYRIYLISFFWLLLFMILMIVKHLYLYFRIINDNALKLQLWLVQSLFYE